LVEHFPVVVVTGARQVGKSTLLHQELSSEWSTVVFDPVVAVEAARGDPERFLNNRPAPLVLAEIQYVPQLVSPLKRRVDRDRSPGQYVLTGSQQWGVLRSLSESLAGRAVFLDLGGFTFSERAGLGGSPTWLAQYLEEPSLAESFPRIQSRCSLYETLWRGALPEAGALPIDLVPDYHRAYLRTYIERDIRLLAEVSDWQLFGRFVRLISALTAQEINQAQLGRELGVAGPTSKRWLRMLSATFQWYEIPAWSRNLIKRVSGRSKGYLMDTGQICAAQVIATPHGIGGHPLYGAIFETGVVLDIARQASLQSPAPNLWHWRSHGGAEVDLIVEYGGVLYPIEIKGTSRPTRRDTSGIAAFRKSVSSKTIVGPGLVIAPVERSQRLTELDTAISWDVTSV